MKNRAMFYGGLVLTALLALPAAVYAPLQTSNSEFHLAVGAGETQQQSFVMTNTGKEKQRYKVYLGDWYRKENGDNVFEEPGKVDGSCTSWITVSPLEFELDPGRTQDVKFSFAAPKGQTGTHWSIIFVEGAPRPGNTVTEGKVKIGVQITERLGIKIYQTFPGTERPDAKVVKVTTTPALDGKPASASFEFVNTGNTHLVCKGKIEVIDSSNGKKVASIPTEDFPVLPGARRIMSLPLEDDKTKLAKGEYQVQAIVDYGGDNLIAGRSKLMVP